MLKGLLPFELTRRWIVLLWCLSALVSLAVFSRHNIEVYPNPPRDRNYCTVGRTLG
jgi:hypothetical protein